MLIKGMQVILLEPTQTDTDPFGKPIINEVEITVDNVLVGQPTTEDMATITDLTGKKASYVLGIPKGDTHEWKDRKVIFFGHTWHTLGFVIEGIEENIPLAWHKKIMVERYE